MKSSPGTPSGCGRIASSSTYMRVFATGAPMGTVRSAAARLHAKYVTSTAASVGP